MVVALCAVPMSLHQATDWRDLAYCMELTVIWRLRQHGNHHGCYNQANMVADACLNRCHVFTLQRSASSLIFQNFQRSTWHRHSSTRHALTSIHSHERPSIDFFAVRCSICFLPDGSLRARKALKLNWVYQYSCVRDVHPPLTAAIVATEPDVNNHSMAVNQLETRHYTAAPPVTSVSSLYGSADIKKLLYLRELDETENFKVHATIR